MFLKSYVFRTEAKVVVISDIDIVVTNPAKITKVLLDFLDEKSPSSSHLTDKGVAVMRRRFSSLRFGKQPEPYRRPRSLGPRAKNGVR